MDLAGVQSRVRDVNPYYVDMLTWEQEGHLVKAIPKGKLSNLAFHLIRGVFKKLGGRFVSPGYFELVLEENGSRHFITSRTLQGNAASESSPAPGTVLEQIQAQLEKLGGAGQELTKEAPL